MSVFEPILQSFAAPWTPSNPRLHFLILEEQPIGTVLTTLTALDADAPIESFRLSANPYFEINNVTGTIRTSARIDYEAIKEIAVTATVVDTGVPQLTATAQLLIDVISANDNGPAFEQSAYEFAVPENSVAGTVIGRVGATDADDGVFGEIVYSLVGDEARHLRIDADTGVLTVFNVTHFDRERSAEVSVTAVATDKAPITTRKVAIVPVSICGGNKWRFSVCVCVWFVLTCVSFVGVSGSGDDSGRE